MPPVSSPLEFLCAPEEVGRRTKYALVLNFYSEDDDGWCTDACCGTRAPEIGLTVDGLLRGSSLNVYRR